MILPPLSKSSYGPAPLVEPIGDLLALDPGINKPGAALFRAGKLVAAERVRLDKDLASLPVGIRAARVADTIIRWGMATGMEPRALVYELPQIYQRPKSKGDPNDLIKVALVAANVSGMLRYALGGRDISMEVHSPLPAEWIGQCPKVVCSGPEAWNSPRGYRIKVALAPEELEVVIPDDNALDAVGLGLWALGRLNVPFGG